MEGVMEKNKMEDEDETECEVDRIEPGASRYGNFINYYKFHPVNDRIFQLPRGIWNESCEDQKYIALDIGCNAGDLTLTLHHFLTSERKVHTPIHILGIDLDPCLIERANQNNVNPQNITFQCLDFFSKNRGSIIDSYLTSKRRKRFDVVFGFSVTMWIHLNHGDSGLKQFLLDICELSNMVVIEPQLWKCYRNAARRLRRAKQPEFPHLRTLTYKGNMEEHIEKILTDECGFCKVVVSNANDWQRKLLIYKRKYI